MAKIFITGGSRRLGRALTLNFAKSGWDVCFSYNNSQTEAEQLAVQLNDLSIKSHHLKLDVTNYQELTNGFSEIVDVFGLPDVIVNNVGIFPVKESLDVLSIETWDSVMKTNLYSGLYLSKIFCGFRPLAGHIINIGSIGGNQIWKGRIPYHISKNGIIHLTKVLARELAPNISVNCVNPGTIYFPDEPDDQHVPNIPLHKIPMNEYATPYNIFKAVEFFSNSPLYITGQVLTVDGGYSL